MMDIVKAIYDMMGKYTYPVLKEDTPRQHVDVFFQVRMHLHKKLILMDQEMLLWDRLVYVTEDSRPHVIMDYKW